jgi:predicted O-methyltransferase YrrM
MIYTLYRLYKALKESLRYTKIVFKYALKSKETATFTFKLMPENEAYLANLTAEILNTTVTEVQSYFNELKENEQLQKTIISNFQNSPYKNKKDKRCDYGSKLSFYAIIRIRKPKIVVENGIEAGFTSVIFCEAIRRNIEEGFNGKFIGYDINTNAGYLVKAEKDYRSFANIVYGETLESLTSFNEHLDFYFSDGLRTYEYEKSEFSCLLNKMQKNAIVITNKAKFSIALYEFSLLTNKRFSYFKEQPLAHWYEGAGLGIMY